MNNPDGELGDMVDRQIAGRGIRDARVLAAMRAVPRIRFVPEEYRGYAHDDRPLPIGCGQTISQPYIVAAMLEALCLSGGERVLEIGTGSGYQTALLSRLAAEVFSVERIRTLHKRASSVLAETGATNVRLSLGDGYEGLPGSAPFDAIILSAAPIGPPPILLGQLSPRGGILVAPVGGAGCQSLVRMVRDGDNIESEWLMDVAFVPMLPGVSEGR